MATKKTQVKDLDGRSVSSSKASGVVGGAKAKSAVKPASLVRKAPTMKTSALKAR